MSLGIRSGVNWMRLKFERQAIGQRADHQRLGQPGHAFEHAMAAGEDGDQQLLDHFVLADDHAGDLLAQAPVSLLQPGQVLQVGRQVVGSERIGAPFGKVVAVAEFINMALGRSSEFYV